MFGMANDDSRNALEILKRDHDAVDKLFAEYEDVKDGADDSEKENLVGQICDALTVHAQIEEAIFYPAARRALQEEESKDLLDEAAVEHQTLKDIIGRLEAAPAGDPLYDAGVKVLSEYVKHHVREEENELFPKVRSSDMDLQAIGQQLAQRKEQLERRGSQRRGSNPRGEKPTRAAGDSRASRNAH
jgi:hemerythrin superfamily protein